MAFDSKIIYKLVELIQTAVYILLYNLHFRFIRAQCLEILVDSLIEDIPPFEIEFLRFKQELFCFIYQAVQFCKLAFSACRLPDLYQPFLCFRIIRVTMLLTASLATDPREQ